MDNLIIAASRGPAWHVLVVIIAETTDVTAVYHMVLRSSSLAVPSTHRYI